jgi:HAD superfamily hydrolase (TIGR01549 family)
MARARAVLFDFAGTLFRHRRDPAWTAGLIGALSRSRSVWDSKLRFDRFDLIPDSHAHLDEDVRNAWVRRDLDPTLHRAAYVGVLRAAGVDRPGMAELLYERLVDWRYWQPYPDTVPALVRLSAAGIPAAVVSNIGWDIRTVLQRYRASRFVSATVTSYEEGCLKPDPRLFLIGCQRLGVAPEDTLMIGDDEQTDGGAASLGIRLSLVKPLPPHQRPAALLEKLRTAGLL